MLTDKKKNLYFNQVQPKYLTVKDKKEANKVCKNKDFTTLGGEECMTKMNIHESYINTVLIHRTFTMDSEDIQTLKFGLIQCLILMGFLNEQH